MILMNYQKNFKTMKRKFQKDGDSMFRGEVLGVMYHSWKTYKKAWNDAVKQGKLFDKNGRKIYKTL